MHAYRCRQMWTDWTWRVQNYPALNDPALLCKSDLEFSLCLKMVTLWYDSVSLYNLKTHTTYRFYLVSSFTHMDWIQYFDGGFAAIDSVKHFINFPISPFTNSLNDLPGIRWIWKAVKDDGFPWARKHLPERSPEEKEHILSLEPNVFLQL